MSGDALTGAEIAAYLGRLWQRTVKVEGLARIPGGASRETYRFDAHDGEKTRRHLLRAATLVSRHTALPENP